MLQMWHFTSFFLEFKSNLLGKSLVLVQSYLPYLLYCLYYNVINNQ